MKKSLVVTSLLIFILACNPTSTDTSLSEDAKKSDPIEGVWELTNHYWILDDDTIYADEVGVQHKIYFDGYVMWTADPGPDSSEWHGYGTYQLSNKTLIEKLSSMSLPMKLNMGSEDEVMLRIEYGPNIYKQEMEQVFRDTIYIAVEEWKRIN